MSLLLQNELESVDSGCLQGPLMDNLADMRIFAGETFSWKICACAEDVDSIAAFNPSTNSIDLNEKGCYADGDCVKIMCHEEGCSTDLLNGEHTVVLVSADGTNLVIDTPMGFTEEQSFLTLPTIPGCSTEATKPPSMCKLQSFEGMALTGCISSRLPTEDTRLALAAVTTQGSNIVRLEEVGEVHLGDVISIPGAGISKATVVRSYEERGCQFIVIKDQVANKTDCGPLSSEVGVLAQLQFKIDECGCAEAYLPASETSTLPLIGDPMDAEAMGSGPASMLGMGGRKSACNQKYRIGIYSIFASYVNEDNEVVSSLIARGCVDLYPTNVAKANYL